MLPIIHLISTAKIVIGGHTGLRRTFVLDNSLEVCRQIIASRATSPTSKLPASPLASLPEHSSMQSASSSSLEG